MTDVRALLDPDDAARLRDALGSADFTVAGIAERIGPAAVAGVGRRDFRALLRATADRDRLGTLLRLFAAETDRPPACCGTSLASWRRRLRLRRSRSSRTRCPWSGISSSRVSQSLREKRRIVAVGGKPGGLGSDPCVRWFRRSTGRR